jgi:hypothetical protein
MLTQNSNVRSLPAHQNIQIGFQDEELEEERSEDEDLSHNKSDGIMSPKISY